MATKDRILDSLLSCRGSYLSGEELAISLGVSRAAVWKGVQALREGGFPIVGQPNRGYCLETGADILSVQGILGLLEPGGPWRLELRDRVPSTNALLREQAFGGALEGTVLLAASQSQGRGRMGRPFFSPADTGVYLSLLLRPKTGAAAGRVTTMAALAACQAVSALSGEDARIKWVNDVFLNGKKVSGILTEAAFSLEDGTPDYVVLGAGFNLYAPQEGFPEELTGIAGAILPQTVDNGKNKLAALFLQSFWDLYRSPRDHLPAYKEKSMVLGKNIWVQTPQGQRSAKALDLDEHCGLIVEYPDGTRAVLKAGEVRIREKKGSI